LKPRLAVTDEQSYFDAAAADAPLPPRISPHVKAIASGGSTGRPKIIVDHTRAVLDPDAPSVGMRATDTVVIPGPMYHSAPFGLAYQALGWGCHVVIMPRFDAEDCLALIERERVTTSHLVPANFVRILEVDWRGHDLSSVRKVLHAAAPCPIPVKRRILEVFPPGSVWEYLGMSEGMATVISSAEWLEHPGSVGRPFPGVSVRICDDDGIDVPPGTVGSIYVSTVPGYPAFRYRNAPDKTDASWRDGFFTVGDLGWLDDDGYLYIADRRTDLVISGGVNIYPAEIEQALVGHADVVDAAVFGLPDERMGQRVHAVVELRAGSVATEEDLLDHLRSTLAAFKLPRTMEFVAALPREPTGKVRKRELREARLGERSGASSDVAR